MAVYTNDLRLKEIATGDESGTWGTSTNTNLSLIADAFSFGTEAITTNADTHTTTIADGSADPGRSIFLKYTGTLDSACTITIGPNTVSKLWFIENATSGSQNIIIKQGSGATITIANGQTKAIYSDGAGSGGAMIDAFQDLSIPDLFIDDDLTFTSDSAVITFGADGDTTLTHTDGSGLTLNSTNKIMFNDASQFIQGSSATVLSLGATDEIDLTATAIDVNGTMDVSGALTGTTATLTTADNLTQLQLVSTDTDANAGPILDLFRSVGSSAADSDQTGSILFTGRNDAPETITYARINSFISDASDGTEDGLLHLKHIVAGSEVAALRLDATEYVFNDSGLDIDFRVESDANTHALFVQASDGNVGVGDSTPDAKLDVFLGATGDIAIFQGDDSDTLKINSGSNAINLDVRNTTNGLNVQMQGTTHFQIDTDGTVFTTTTASGTAVKAESSNASSSAGPGLVLYRNSSSPADNDETGSVTFEGRNDASQDVAYALIQSRIMDASDGTEDGALSISAMFGGTNRSRIDFNNTETNVNQSGQDLDFRVESDSKTHALFVQGSDGFVGINATPTHPLEVAINSSGQQDLLLLSNDNTATSNTAGILFAPSNGITGARIECVAMEDFSSSANRTADLAFYVRKDGTISERMRLDSDGSLTVTRSDNGAVLTVKSTDTDASRGPILDLNRESASSAADNDYIGELRFLGNNDANESIAYAGIAGRILDASDGTEDGRFELYTERAGTQTSMMVTAASEIIFNNDSIDLDFRIESNSNTHMLFVDAGNNRVGINTSSPESDLHVTKSASGARGPTLTLDNTAGSSVGNECQITFLTDSGASVAGISNARMKAVNVNAGNGAADIRFDTWNGSAEGERVRITSSGSLLVNETTAGAMIHATNANQTSTTLVALVDEGGTGAHTQISFANTNGQVGTINTSGSATAYNTSSDYRLKENITDLTDATDRLKQLAPKRFNFKADADTTVDGFIAHEVSPIVPEAITGTKDAVDADGNPEYQGIDQSKLVPLLVATIKELEARIAALESE